MIVESIVITRDARDAPHIAPIGVHRVEDDGRQLYVIVPFRPSRTLDNLVTRGECTINLTDDVRVYAGVLTGQRRWPTSGGDVLKETVRLSDTNTHIELRLLRIDDDPRRPRLVCEPVHQVAHRPFMGFNRAQGAVLEGAILVSRIGSLSRDRIEREFALLQRAIDRTAGEREREAWRWLHQEMQRQMPDWVIPQARIAGGAASASSSAASPAAASLATAAPVTTSPAAGAPSMPPARTGDGEGAARSAPDVRDPGPVTSIVGDAAIRSGDHPPDAVSPLGQPRPRLMISVGDIDELNLALDQGIEVLDLKDARAGPLGAVDVATVQRLIERIGIHQWVANRSSPRTGRTPVSATIGDLPMDVETVLGACRERSTLGLDYVKVGLPPEPGRDDVIDALGAQSWPFGLVAVLFGDRTDLDGLTAEAPPEALDALLARLQSAGFAGVVIDTFDKHRRLTTLHPVDRLTQLVSAIHGHQMFCGLAGSLGIGDLTPLVATRTDLIGLRGGVCDGADRLARLSARRLAEAARMLDAARARIGATLT